MNDLTFGDVGAWLWGAVALGLFWGFLWLGTWRRGRLEELGARGPLPGLLGSRARAVQPVRAALVVLAAVLLTVTLMRPQFGSRETEVKNLGIDIAVALDASKSMKVKDVVPDRLQAARVEVKRLLDTLTGGRVGLVPFAGLAFVQTPLTSDFDVVKTYLDDLRVEDMPRGGTAIGRAIIEALRVLVPPAQLEGTVAELPKPGADAAADAPPPPEDDGGLFGALEEESYKGSKNKAIILFTDGDDHEGDPLKAADLAAKLGVRIYAVGVGTSQGRPVPLVNEDGKVTGTLKGADGTPTFSELNAELLTKIADRTGGAYFHLGPDGLANELVGAMDTLEKREFEATFQELSADQYHVTLVPAVLLLLLEAWLSSRRRRRRSP